MGDPGPWLLARMTEEDLPAIMRIEIASFGTPWPAGAFLEEMRATRYAHCLVARAASHDEKPGPPAGYICYWILEEELLVNNLAVDQGMRRRGLGKMMLQHALAQARDSGCETAYLDVRASNDAAIRLYEAHGFVKTSRRRRYYSDTGEDALVMRADLRI